MKLKIFNDDAGQENMCTELNAFLETVSASKVDTLLVFASGNQNIRRQRTDIHVWYEELV